MIKRACAVNGLLRMPERERLSWASDNSKETKLDNTMIAQGLVVLAILFNIVNITECAILANTSDEKLQEMGINSRLELAAKIGRRRDVGMAVFLLAIVAYQFIHPVGLVSFQ